jgi:tripartite-type tricarboxylate transporter receptor subunit TctC
VGELAPLGLGKATAVNKAKLAIFFAACAVVIGFAAPAPAQEWPARPIRMIVSFGPGGGADIVGRIIAQSMQEKLGQPVVVENRPGGGRYPGQ